MAVRFVLPPNAADAVTTTYSPLAELVLSLRVLAFPEKHPLKHAWVRRARRLDPGLRRRIAAFRFAFRCGMPDQFFPPAAAAPASFAEELEYLRSLDPRVLASQLEDVLRMDRRLERTNGNALAGSRLAEAAIARFGADAEDQAAAIRILATDRERAVTEFLALLEDYWRASFADDWTRIEPLLARANANLETDLDEDFYATVSRLQHQLHGDPAASSIAVDVRAERTLTVGADRKLVLVPSTFVWPDMMVKYEGPGPTGFVYPAPISARLADAEGVDGDLIKLAKALGDSTRLRALKLLAREARTTQELAPLLGITESGLSKHLRVLAEAGVVRTRRQGYYVIYRVVPERIATLSTDLLAFLTDREPGFRSSESVAAPVNE